MRRGGSRGAGHDERKRGREGAQRVRTLLSSERPTKPNMSLGRGSKVGGGRT